MNFANLVHQLVQLVQLSRASKTWSSYPPCRRWGHKDLAPWDSLQEVYASGDVENETVALFQGQKKSEMGNSTCLDHDPNSVYMFRDRKFYVKLCHWNPLAMNSWEETRPAAAFLLPILPLSFFDECKRDWRRKLGSLPLKIRAA